MKKILILAVVLTAFTTARSQSNVCGQKEDNKNAPAKETTEAMTTRPDVVPDATPAMNGTAVSSSDKYVIYVGTNDFYLALVREGINKA